MKQILLALLLGVMTIAVDAHHPGQAGSSLLVFTEGPRYLDVFVNGYRVNKRPSQQIYIDALRPGRHLLEIRTVDRHGTRYMSRIIHLQAGTGHEFVVNGFGIEENWRYRQVVLFDQHHGHDYPPKFKYQNKKRGHPRRIRHHNRGW